LPSCHHPEKLNLPAKELDLWDGGGRNGGKMKFGGQFFDKVKQDAEGRIRPMC